MEGKTSPNDWVYCIKCQENGRCENEIGKCSKQEIETNQWFNWTCHKCRTEIIGLQLIDFIKTRISVTATEEEDRSKFIFRELLQNADDVSSKILVLRFETDALYVANDGRAFTTTGNKKNLSDFEKISKILGRHQEEDKETVGHFGSGFQTVYAITNKPEVHSNGTSGQMNPITKKWNYDIKKRTSPFIKQSCKGVLFRFPWRDDQKAKETIDGVSAFEDSNYWPRWNRAERKVFFKDLIEYMHQALLCCRNLKTVRLIWHEKNEYKGFQVTRDFVLRVDDEKGCKSEPFVGKIEQGFIEPKDWKDDWDDTFQHDGWNWKSGKISKFYFIGSMSVVNDAEKTLHFGKKPDGKIVITPYVENLTKELKNSDVHLLLPLFDASAAFVGDGRAFLYSVIPLPKKSENMFAFSAHFFPTEDRKDVDVEGYGGMNRLWYEQVMGSVGKLYLHMFPFFLEKLNSLAITDELKQKILLNNLPVVPLHEWMRSGREQNPEWSKDLTDKMMLFIAKQPILFSNGKWMSPEESFWPKDDNEQAVIQILGAKPFTSTFMEHRHFVSIQKHLESRKLTVDYFNCLWENFIIKNSDENFDLKYNQKLHEKNLLDTVAVMELIKYCITRKDALQETSDKAIVPGKDDIFRPLKEYPLLDEKLEILYEIMPNNLLIHDDFKSILKEKRDKQKLTDCDEVITIIDCVVNSDINNYGEIDDQKQRIISKVLEIIVLERDFVLKESHCNLRFIPYKQGKCHSFGTPNTRLDGNNLLLIQGKHAGENYQRESIFGVQRLDVPGLTDEVSEKIKFLNIVDCEEESVEKIEDALDLEKLMERPKTPVNFVRHFLSLRHGSLFEDNNLEKFLETDDKNLVRNQKIAFQNALKEYFDTKHLESYLRSEDMGKVPCLFDAKEKWYPAGDFALKMYPELELIGYKSLHNSFESWKKDILLALGVAESPDVLKIISTVKNLIHEEESGINNRRNITNILVWLLTSDMLLTKDFDDLKNVKWIPTRAKGYQTPNDVLNPSKDNIEIMGNNYESFFDYSDCSYEIAQNAEERMDGEVIDKKKLSIVGLKCEPNFLDMLQVLVQTRNNYKEPPPMLFDTLSSMIRNNHELILNKQNETYGYYYESEWVESTRVRILDKETVPQELWDKIIILPPNIKHADYLFFDGAKSFIDPEDILKPLADGDVTPSLNLWDILRNNSAMINEKHREDFKNCAIYPLNERLVKPKDIILNDVENEDLDGVFGKYCILGQIQSLRHLDALKKLGSRILSEIQVDDLFDIIRSMKINNETLEPDVMKSVASLIKRVIKLNPTAQFPNEELWPAVKSGTFIWVKPKNGFLKDSPIAEYFEDDLAFLDVEINGKIDEVLQNYALNCGVKVFSERLKQSGIPSVSYPVPDNDLKAVLNEMAIALEKNYETSASNCFDWLKQIQVNRCDELAITYAVDEFKRKIKKFSLIATVDSINQLIVQYGNVILFDELADEILKKCTEKTLPKKIKTLEELKFLIYKLLTHHPVFWHDLIEGYEYSGNSLIPEISPQEGGKGYLETRSTLQRWYGCCQICGNQTPKDANGFETLEQVKSIVTSRGGRYHGYREGYSIENCILLCPRHQKLFERGLVKFLDFEKKIVDSQLFMDIDERKNTLQTLNEENPDAYEKIYVEVFEGKNDLNSESQRKVKTISRWEKRKITFTRTHLMGLLENMGIYFKDKK